MSSFAIILALSITLLSMAYAQLVATDKRPNIIILFCDDLGWGSRLEGVLTTIITTPPE